MHVHVHVRQIVIFIVFASAIGALALGIALSYWIIHNLRAFTDDFFDAYPKRTQAILNDIGEGRVRGAYVVRVPFSEWLVFAANIVTSYAYQRHMGTCKEHHPHHTALLCEVETPHHGTKLVLIDKDSRVHVRDDFVMTRGWSFMRVPDLSTLTSTSTSNVSITLSELLNRTRNTIGDRRFFNWNLHRNNCNRLTHELVNTLLSSVKNRQEVVDRVPQELRRFIHGRGRQMLRLMARRDDFAMHILSCSQMLYNMVEKHFMDMTLFGSFFQGIY